MWVIDSLYIPKIQFSQCRENDAGQGEIADKSVQTFRFNLPYNAPPTA